MMNKNKLNKGFSFKFLALLPVATILFFGVACVKGQDTTEKENVTEAKPVYNDYVTAIEPVKMNILYAEVDNPVKIAVSGFESSEISPSITNGSIRNLGNGNYIIHPRRPGNMIVSVKVGEEEVQRTEFRIRGIPVPVAMVNGKKSGEIDKNVLLEQDELVVYLPNFDFDLSFEVVEFILSTTNDKGVLTDSKSNSNKITDEQKDIIKNAAIGSIISFEHIKAKGPDGSIRKIAPIVFVLQ